MSVVSQAARFARDAADERGDYSSSRPGAFTKSMQSRPAVGAMGGTSARSSVFDPAPKDVPDMIYDQSSTGAFAKATKASGSSAAFASKSGRFDRPTSATPSSTTYEANYNTIGAAANKSVRTGGGGFGSSKRFTTAWGDKSEGDGRTPRAGRPPLAPSSEEAPIASSFGQPSNRHKGPSAAFGGSKDRFAPARESTPGPGEYTARKPLESKSTNAVARSTMGSGERFARSSVDERTDYSSARPSAFSTSKSQSRLTNTGFGGTSSRASSFDTAAAAAAKNAPAVGEYDGAYAATGAFASVVGKSTGPSSAFASKSEQHTATKAAATPGAGSYNSARGSMAADAGKTFNKSAAAGTGGFGTSVRRAEFSAPREDAPGPGAYDASSTNRIDARPSSAFASKSVKQAELRQTAAPSVGSYDAHSTDSMAATATKTFNKNVDKVAMGGGSSRFAPAAKDTAPGPGEYTDLSSTGAFSTSKSHSRMTNTGFGGTSGRKSTFDEVRSEAPDTYYATVGAFDKAAEASAAPSAGFASKSSQRASVEAAATPGAGSYNSARGSMAADAGKTFNKSAAAGTGGFGTSVRRAEFSAPREDAPGPGAYDASSTNRIDARPSSAFASKSVKQAELRQTAAPSVGSYDAHSTDSMAATAKKSFNVKAGTGHFGPRAARQM